MSPNKLLIVNIPHSKGEKLTRAAVETGCRGGTVLSAKSLAKSNLGAIFGFGDTPRDLILMVVNSKSYQKIKDVIVKTCFSEKKNFGELFSIDVGSTLKAGIIKNSTSEDDSQIDEIEENIEDDEMQTVSQERIMNSQNKKEMITVIVNKGYAEDVMFAARKAGAGGGTVLNALGTAKETDQRFFGVHIVPEKDMLIIIVEKEKKDDVLKAIAELKCLKEPGLGIAFSSEIQDFALLGKN